MRRSRVLLLALAFFCILQPTNTVGAAAVAATNNQKGSSSSQGDQDTNNRKDNKNNEGSSPTRSHVPAIQPHGVKQAEENKKPIELTARNFGRLIGDGNVWLVEFYSPNCVHCLEFSSTYAEMAVKYHTTTTDQNDRFQIKIAKINGESERALTSRFGLYAYPTFYVVDGWSVYEYKGATRTKRTLMSFVEGGYKEQDPIPFYVSPMGPMGLMQGTLIAFGLALSDLFSWTEKTFGLSPLVTGGVLFGSMFMSSFFTIVVLAIVITPKVKNE